MSPNPATVHVLTCGTSIIDNLTLPPRGGDRPNEDPLVGKSQRSDFAEALSVEDDAPTENVIGIVEGLTRELREFIAGCHDRRLSAEIASLGIVPVHRYRPNGDNRAVFLVSSTSRGILAGLLNAAWLAGSIRYFDAPPDGGGDQPTLDGPGLRREGTADVVRIDRLTHANINDFSIAAGNLALALRYARRAAGQHLVAHLSGGYKAVIPIVTGVLEQFETQAPTREAWCVHELSEGAVRLPLRAGDGPFPEPGLYEAIRTVREHHIRPEPDRWAGYAYRSVGNRWELTELGAALWGVLPSRERGAGG